MKTVKVFAVKMEIEVAEEDIQDRIDYMKEEMGESISAEHMFENIISDFQYPSEEVLAEFLMEPNFGGIQIKELEIVELF